MKSCNRFNVKSLDTKNCLVEIDVCDNVMECVTCSYFLQKRNQVITNEIISSEKKLPKKITRIKIPLLPLPANKPYYSYNGIETIIYNLFRTDNNKHINGLLKYKSVIKVYYEKNSLFNVPIIQIEVIFFGSLHPKSIDELWETLKKDILFFTGSVGDIDKLEISNQAELEKILEIPLLIGCPEFKLEGVFKEHKFSMEQLTEMNYLHLVSPIPLEMNSVINNNTLELFQVQREAIERDELNSTKNQDKYRNDDVSNVINALCSKNRNNRNNNLDNEDDLPF